MPFIRNKPKSVPKEEYSRRYYDYKKVFSATDMILDCDYEDNTDEETEVLIYGRHKNSYFE